MTRVRVSKPSGSGFAVHWTALLAQQLGFYADEGLEVEIIALDQAAGTDALLAGDVPVMRRGPDESIALIAGGAPLRLVAGLVNKPPIYLFATRDVASIPDLRGRTIAGISARFGSSLVLRMLLDDEGLAEDDYEIVHTGGSHARLAALEAGRAAAAVLSPPTNRRAEEAGFSLLASLPDRYPQFMFSAIQTQTAFAERQSDVLAGLLKAELRAQRVLADPQWKGECAALLAAADAVSVADAIDVYDTMVEADRVFAAAGEIEGAALEHLLRSMVRFGDVRASLRAADCVDRRYMDEAQRALAMTSGGT